MWICLDCGRVFEETKHYTETHGLSAPPYEEYDACPRCGGAYATAFRCDCCDKWITDTYVKTKAGERYCENCYMPMDLGEED